MPHSCKHNVQRHAYIHVQLFEFDCLCSCPTVGLQVVVAGDATFQDVKTEIARVYQGLSSASLDERYTRRLCLISVSLGDESYCLCLPIYVHAVSYPVCSFNQISLATYMLWSLGDENCYSKTLRTKDTLAFVPCREVVLFSEVLF